MPSKPMINIPGRYVWRLMFDHDNSGNAGSIERTTEIQISWSYTSQKFNETVTSSAKKLAESGRVELEAGASYGVASINVKAGYEASKEISSALQETTKQQREETVSYSRKETRKYTIGAHSKLVAYRRFFECAGVLVEEDIVITRPAALPDNELVKEVPVELMLEPQTFIKAIKVMPILYKLFCKLGTAETNQKFI
ncbi:hypothetical protein C0992_008595 [Termitomyces sp. T32_za158]|nr:hypothetical protein C0992_008595 [Termitomyces sp. T32_za158]